MDLVPGNINGVDESPVRRAPQLLVSCPVWCRACDGVLVEIPGRGVEGQRPAVVQPQMPVGGTFFRRVEVTGCGARLYHRSDGSEVVRLSGSSLLAASVRDSSFVAVAVRLPKSLGRRPHRGARVPRAAPGRSPGRTGCARWPSDPRTTRWTGVR